MPPEVSFSLQNVTAVCEMVSSQAYLCEKKYSRAGMNAFMPYCNPVPLDSFFLFEKDIEMFLCRAKSKDSASYI